MREHNTLEQRRMYWIDELADLSNSFANDVSKLIEMLKAEIAAEGSLALIQHLRICGVMPERYGRDSSEEKLYSKYTDTVLSESFRAMGFTSSVISARSDAADVRAIGSRYSLVADARRFGSAEP